MRTPGKKMPNGYYVHKSSYEVLENLFDIDYHSFLAAIPPGFQFDILKYNPKQNQMTFTRSSDWDTANEPTVENAVLVKADGSIKFIKQHKDPWIYHHKWMFVTDDYTGFDVEKSKRRSQWTSIPNINKSKIGKKSYWESKVLPMLR